MRSWLRSLLCSTIFRLHIVHTENFQRNIKCLGTIEVKVKKQNQFYFYKTVWYHFHSPKHVFMLLVITKLRSCNYTFPYGKNAAAELCGCEGKIPRHWINQHLLREETEHTTALRGLHSHQTAAVLSTTGNTIKKHQATFNKLCQCTEYAFYHS